MHEIASAGALAPATSAPAAAGGASAVAVAAAAAKSAATPATVLQLQPVGGFEVVVRAVVQLLVGVSGSGRGVGEALGVDRADALAARQYLLAARKALPNRSRLTRALVWCGPQDWRRQKKRLATGR